MSRIELEVPAKSLRLFAKTLSCMSKIGNEVFLEGREERLVLRALSASRSAFAGITLHRAFFDHYSLSTTAVAAVGGTASSSGSSSSACRCQVKLKALCAVFRSAALAQVERCVVVADTLQARLYVDLHCHRGVVKQYRIPFDDESEALEARYDTTGASRIVVRPRVLLDALANFRQTSADELTLILPPRTAPATARILLRSTPVPPADPMQAPVVTECALDPHSLDEYSVEPAPNITASGGGGAGVYEGGTSLTFSLKDFKHVCSLCEVVALPMTLQVTRSGQPLVCSTRFFNTFEAVFVQATLLEHPQQQPTPSSTQGSASKQPAMMPKHEAKQSPSTPGVAAAAAAASAMVKKRPPSPMVEPVGAPLGEIESKRQKPSPASTPTQPATPAILPQGRLFLGDEEIMADATAATAAISGDGAPATEPLGTVAPAVEVKRPYLTQGRAPMPSDDDDGDNSMTDVGGGPTTTTETAAAAANTTVTPAAFDDSVPASCPRLG